MVDDPKNIIEANLCLAKYLSSRLENHMAMLNNIIAMFNDQTQESHRILDELVKDGMPYDVDPEIVDGIVQDLQSKILINKSIREVVMPFFKMSYEVEKIKFYFGNAEFNINRRLDEFEYNWENMKKEIAADK